jgi:hypothetical protein
VAEHVDDQMDKSAYRVIGVAVVIVERKTHGEIATDVGTLESRLRKAQIGFVGDVTSQGRVSSQGTGTDTSIPGSIESGFHGCGSCLTISGTA